MKASDPIKLVSELLDLPIVDKNERSCGIVDDIEFSGGPGKQAKLTVLLVGPGAYKGRLPGWMLWFVRRIAGDRVARVPMREIIEVGPVVKLKCAGETLGLHESENRAARWIPRRGAL